MNLANAFLQRPRPTISIPLCREEALVGSHSFLEASFPLGPLTPSPWTKEDPPISMHHGIGDIPADRLIYTTENITFPRPTYMIGNNIWGPKKL